MLRTTIGCFAAAVGGADAITVLPFTAARGLPDAFARRIARNTQLILLEESNLARVADPTAGAGAIEDITGKLGRAAWSLFQEIEAAGGAWAAIERGMIQGSVAAVREKRLHAVARRKDALTGTSDFADLKETPPAVLDVPTVAAPKESAAAVSAEALPRIRLAEPFERLRDASDRILAQTGSRPKVFLANLGKLSDFTARASFARNFFEAGGIEAVTNDGFASSDEMAAAFKASGARLACLCSSDPVYGADAVDAAKALAGAAHIYLAGRPRELEPALKAAGVGTFIFAGCDVLEILERAYDILTRSG
jgi:methylmalonyl-CoA mutase